MLCYDGTLQRVLGLDTPGYPIQQRRGGAGTPRISYVAQRTPAVLDYCRQQREEERT